jgi:hypothetical protein
MTTNTQNAVRFIAQNNGWIPDWDNHIQFRTERDGLIVHVEWTRTGRIRWASLETRIAKGVSRVEKVAVPKSKDKFGQIHDWLTATR